MAKSSDLYRAVFMSSVLLTATACSAGSSGTRLRVGTEPGHDGGPAGTGRAGAGALTDSGIAVGGGALSVRVQDIKKMTITLVTLQCSGDCADVVAVATGGHAPYAFKWDDGSRIAKRHVCPSSSTHFAVSVTDTAIADGEFPYAAHTAHASVTAQVLDCTDGGSCNALSSCRAGTYKGTFSGNNVTSDAGTMPAAGNVELPQSGTLSFTLASGTLSDGRCGMRLNAGVLNLMDGSAAGTLLTTSDTELSGSLDCGTGAFSAVSVNGTWQALGIPAGPLNTTLSGVLDASTSSITGMLVFDAGGRRLVGTFTVTLAQ